jgi:hypothetical protein
MSMEETMRTHATAIGLALLLAACGGGLSEEETMELAQPHIKELAAARAWTGYERLGPGETEEGMRSVWINATVASDSGEAEEYWRIDVSKTCKFLGSCETKTTVAQLAEKGAVAAPIK